MGVKRKTIQDAHNLAESRGFKFLSPEFKNTGTKHLWECSKEHEFSARYDSIKKGQGCPYCSKKVPKKTIEDAYRLAEKKGGKFLSSVYINSRTKHEWQCDKKHVWIAKYNDIYNGNWCPECSNKKRKTIKYCQQIAEEKGGKCLSDYYINCLSKLNWQCHMGHRFMMKLNAILAGNQWCPICADRTKGEKLTRYCFEKMLLCDFKKIRPDWMRNPETGRKLELDGYNENMNLAFEHQGIHHETGCEKNNKHYDPEVFVRDEIKRQKCKERGVTLIEVPEIGRRLKLKDVVPFLLSEFDKHNIAYPESAKSFQIDMREFYAEYMNEKSTTGVDDLLKEIDAMDFWDESLFDQEVVNELENLDFDDPDLFA